MVAPSSLNLMIVAGEASGDAHAAALVRALRAAAPERQFEFFGSTGALPVLIQSSMQISWPFSVSGKSARLYQNSGELSAN
jgi:lipid A disaccharide synthetase